MTTFRAKRLKLSIVFNSHKRPFDRIRAEIGYKGVVTLLHSLIVQETENSQFLDFLSKLTFHMNKTFALWDKSLQLS